MRKHQQQEILDLLEIIKKAQSMGVYADCQDGVSAIIDYIDSIEGKGTQTAALLSEHYELLVKAHSGKINKELLQNNLIKINNKVKQELKPNRIEIAFLSYKASMSDSIESIYLAAKANPNCDAYWIPIPYFDRNSDGSLKTMHYEGAECYGSNIDCTNWREYDIATRRPDIIFTFSPYDIKNLVTVVHPDFFCERLRSLTDLLVYVPYFVDPYGFQEHNEHLCTVAGCKYAHLVVLQSKNIRDNYVRVFKKQYGDEFGIPEKKFIALGSPKFDKVIKTEREDCKLPDEWQKLIGSKKVVFYNTSLAAILADKEQYLKKLRHVLDIFRNRDDVVLWWRPHPLSEATYTSMRSQLLDQYERITADFKHEGWGIYDDTKDLHRALAWSDAYYGDHSSVTALYAATGKPVMIQNAYFHSENTSSQYLQFQNLYDDGKYFWFTAFFFNALFRMDKQTWRTEYMGSFPEEKFASICMYETSIEHNGKLYFAPRSARKIGVYDLKSGSFETIPFEENEDADNTLALKFYCAFSYKSKIYFVGYQYPAIICYDTSNGQIKRFDDWLELLKPLKSPSESGFFWGGTVAGSKLFLPLCCADAVLEFDMDEEVFQIHHLKSGNPGFNCICFCGGYAWLMPRYENTIIRWDNLNNEILKHTIPDVDSEVPGVHDLVNLLNYCYSIPIKDCVYFFPFFTNNVIKFNTTNGEITPVTAFQQECEQAYSHFNYVSIYRIYAVVKLSDNKLYAKTIRSNTFIEYDLETNSRRAENISMPDNIHKIIENLYLSLSDEYGVREKITDCIFNEQIYFDLESFINYNINPINSTAARSLRQRQLDLAFADYEIIDGSAGKRIYDYCVKVLKEKSIAE